MFQIIVFSEFRFTDLDRGRASAVPRKIFEQESLSLDTEFHRISFRKKKFATLHPQRALVASIPSTLASITEGIDLLANSIMAMLESYRTRSSARFCNDPRPVEDDHRETPLFVD